MCWRCDMRKEGASEAEIDMEGVRRLRDIVSTDGFAIVGGIGMAMPMLCTVGLQGHNIGIYGVEFKYSAPLLRDIARQHMKTPFKDMDRWTPPPETGWQKPELSLMFRQVLAPGQVAIDDYDQFYRGSPLPILQAVMPDRDNRIVGMDDNVSMPMLLQPPLWLTDEERGELLSKISPNLDMAMIANPEGVDEETAQAMMDAAEHRMSGGRMN